MEMLDNSFAKLCREPPKVVNPVLVSVQANGEKQLIADLRHLNCYLKPKRFKLDDLAMALPALRWTQYLFSFDFQKFKNIQL